MHGHAPVSLTNTYLTLHVTPQIAKADSDAADKAVKEAEKEIELKAYGNPRDVEKAVKSYFKDIPLMATIAKCESHFRQYNNDGNIYRGKVNTKDVGVMQINEAYHLKSSQNMGLDIYTAEGNMKYARYLYKNEGSAPWISSSACWDSNQTAEKSSEVARAK